MPAIDIKRSHAIPLADARAKVEHVARHLAERFDMDWAWEGNTLQFRRSGVDGHIKVNPKSLHVTAELGFLLMALRGTVEKEIHRYLDEEFG